MQKECSGTFVVVSRMPVSGQVLPPSMNHFLMADLSYVIPVSACAGMEWFKHRTTHASPEDPKACVARDLQASCWTSARSRIRFS